MIIKPKRKRKQIDKELRQEIAAYSFQHSTALAAEKYKVGVSTVHAYRRKYNPENAVKVDVPQNNQRVVVSSYVSDLIKTKNAEIQVLEQLLRSL